MSNCLLELDNVHTYYGSAHILQGISICLGREETIALLGRNGTGKTTTMKTIMSIVPPKKGRIFYNGENLISLPPYVVARKGISMVPEGRHIFPALSVMDHLRVPISSFGSHRANKFKRVFDIFPELKSRRRDKAVTLSGGLQQMLVIARALMCDPKVLLLDEPMEGLAPKAVERVIESLMTIQKEGVSILFASTNFQRAFKIARRAYIIEKGKIVFHLTVDELADTLEVQKRYLGVRG